jgi:DNA-binding PadR family transcriptional regulator
VSDTAVGLAEWTVLAVLDREPSHGFAVAALTEPEGPLGRVWHVPRPVVYRAIGRLVEAGLLEAMGEVEGHGPRRQLHRATPEGHVRVQAWLITPVKHVREVRSELLMKLALLDHQGRDTYPLLRRQRELLEPIVAGLARRTPEPGFEGVLATWRRTNAEAVLAFLDALT